MDIRRGKGGLGERKGVMSKETRDFRNTHLYFFKVHGADHFSYHFTDAGSSSISP